MAIALLEMQPSLSRIESNTWEIGKNYPVDVGMWADPRMGLRVIGEVLERNLTPAARKRAGDQAIACQQEKQLRRERADAMARLGWDDAPISGERLFHTIRDVLPAGAIVVDGVLGRLRGAVRDYLEFAEPGSWLRMPGASCLGWALGCALGAKLAHPNRPVVTFVGDGEIMYNIQALWTAARYNIPVTCIVCNNKGYEILKTLMLTFLRSNGMPHRESQFTGMTIDEPGLDFAKIAQGFGVWGKRVEHPQDLEATLQEALALGKPALVEVVVEGATVRHDRARAARITR